MNPSTPTTDSDPNGNTSLMMLPEPVVGIIDLETLKEIQHFLNQSMLQEDLDLAAWVQKRFLYEPITLVGRDIRTTESFSQLDRAYRRVRSLTNKAQDKWPFFNRDWKPMSSTIVRNNARGEAALGVALSGRSSTMHDSPMSDGQAAHTNNNYSTSSPFVPFGTSKPTRHDPQCARRQQSFANPVPNTPVPLPPIKQEPRKLRSKAELPLVLLEKSTIGTQMQPEVTSTEALSKHQDSDSIEIQMAPKFGTATELDAEAVQALFEEPASMAKPAPAIEDTARSLDLVQTPFNDAAHDPDSGKVRGSNGRFMPKENSGRPKRELKTKPARKFTKRESVDADSIAATTPALANPEHDMMADVLPSPASMDHDKPEDQDSIALQATKKDEEVSVNNVSPALDTAGDMIAVIDRSVSESQSNGFQDDPSPQSMLDTSLTELPSALSSSPASPGLTYSYTLAAESDPVPSNLDRLPPGSRLNKKRKSEAAAQEGPRRKRGRPLKAEQPKMQGVKDTAKKAAAQPSAAPAADATVAQEVSRVSTRRTTRRSVAAKLEETTRVKPAPKQPSPEKQSTQAEHDENETMVDVDDADASAGHKASPTVPGPVKAPSPRLTRAKAVNSNENPSKLNLFALDDEPKVAETVDPLSLGLGKTGPLLKRSEIKKPATSKLTNGTTPASSMDSATAIQSGTKIDFFARVQTSTGMAEVPMTANDLQDDVKMIHKYAEWTEKEGMEITYHAFKSIFGLAKKV